MQFGGRLVDSVNSKLVEQKEGDVDFCNYESVLKVLSSRGGKSMSVNSDKKDVTYRDTYLQNRHL